MFSKRPTPFLIFLFSLAMTSHSYARNAAGTTLLNVSYAPTAEFYQEYNQSFIQYWKAKTGQTITIEQSHGGSGNQSRSVIDGLEADVVTLALGYDIDAISQKSGLLPADWQKRLPNDSCPYTSTIVFLVRNGNPRNIRDWDDLIKPGVSIIVPNPKISGAARWDFLAVWGYAYTRYGTQEAARDYATQFYRHVLVMDSGSRSSTTSFAQRKLGDVLVTWENEAFLALQAFPQDHFEIVTPSCSILAEPPVAWVDQMTQKHHASALAQAYLKFLYSRTGQKLIVKYHFRPTCLWALRKYADQFPSLKMFTIDLFGGWQKAQATFFADGGIFDQIHTH